MRARLYCIRIEYENARKTPLAIDAVIIVVLRMHNTSAHCSQHARHKCECGVHIIWLSTLVG